MNEQVKFPEAFNCLRCGHLLWSGGPPTAQEFPLTCGGEGCVEILTLEEYIQSTATGESAAIEQGRDMRPSRNRARARR